MQYTKTLEQYQVLYNVSRRTVQRWKKKGLPLDDEEQTRAIIGSSGLDAETEVPRPRGTGPVGLKASIDRLREAERDSHAAYQAAIDAGDEVAAARRNKEWLALSEQLRKVELSTPEAEEANRQSVSLSDLQATLGELFARLRQDLDSLPQRIALELVGNDEIGIREVLKRETETLISNLYYCKYLGGAEGEVNGEGG